MRLATLFLRARFSCANVQKTFFSLGLIWMLGSLCWHANAQAQNLNPIKRADAPKELIRVEAGNDPAYPRGAANEERLQEMKALEIQRAEEIVRERATHPASVNAE